MNINIQIDEIHTKDVVEYRAGKLSGFSDNKPGENANRVQCFMISSLYSKDKDVVALYPVKNMTAEYLKSITLDVIEKLTISGYNIISIISDNNVVNRKMFAIMSDDKILHLPFI